MVVGIWRICWETGENSGHGGWHVFDQVVMARFGECMANEDPAMRVWLESRDGTIIDLESTTYVLRFVNMETAHFRPIDGMEKLTSHADVEKEASLLHDHCSWPWQVMIQASNGLSWVYARESYG